MKTGFIASDQAGEYVTERSVSATDILSMAKQLIQRKYQKGRVITSPQEAAEFLPFKLYELEQETFWVMFLSNSHRVLAFEKMFVGTVNQSAVYPREVVKRSLQLNAAALIFAHNHPSGDGKPSQADIQITKRLKGALDLIDIIVLDHFVVAGDTATSMADLGYC